MDRLPIVSRTATLATLPSECYLLLLSTMSKEQLKAIMCTSKKLLEAYRLCEKRVRNMRSIIRSHLQESEPSPLLSRGWSFLALEGEVFFLLLKENGMIEVLFMFTVSYIFV
jgi:hypothetical protein